MRVLRMAKGRGRSMAYLLGLSAVLAAYILGRATMCILYKEERKLDWKSAAPDALLVGGMMIIGLAWVAHVGAVFLGRSFSDCRNMFMILVGVMLAASLLVLFPVREKAKKREPEFRILHMIFGAMVLVQIILLVAGQQIYRDGDMTVETVNTMLCSDTLYQRNPMTGQAYELGLPMRLKILCLPTLYACLCSIFGMPTTEVVWVWVPVFTLLGSYFAMGGVAKVLFPEHKDRQLLFLIFVALLFFLGNYQYGMDGFGVQYAGYRGVTIRGTVLIPYLFAALLRRRKMPALLCIVVEACIVWTLYGMGACLLIAVLWTGIGFVSAVVRRCLAGGKEADA